MIDRIRYILLQCSQKFRFFFFRGEHDGYVLKNLNKEIKETQSALAALAILSLEYKRNVPEFSTNLSTNKEAKVHKEKDELLIRNEKKEEMILI